MRAADARKHEGSQDVMKDARKTFPDTNMQTIIFSDFLACKQRFSDRFFMFLSQNRTYPQWIRIAPPLRAFIRLWLIRIFQSA
ncbi:MAG: hypothetical protein ACRESJ_19870 [Pseudomonas sp.]|uniref:hypothetical protein n=1 Tax=Pseudomonas sp. TaxID=306 RepID=UPI003D6FE63D